MAETKKQIRKAEKAQKAKAPAAPVNGKATVQGTLVTIFQMPELPEAESIIARVLKATGRTLKLSTLRLYKAKFNAGGFGVQKGVRPKVKVPPLQTAK